MADNTPETTENQEAAPEAAPAPKAETHTIRLSGGLLKTTLSNLAFRQKWPEFRVGDVVKVAYKIREGDKERLQSYEGTVISIRGEDLGKSFMVRRISHDVGVERIFPYHSPFISKVELARKGRVRRAKLFYLRQKSGKAGRIKEARS